MSERAKLKLAMLTVAALQTEASKWALSAMALICATVCKTIYRYIDIYILGLLWADVRPKLKQCVTFSLFPTGDDLT